MEDRIAISVNSGVADVRLARSEKMNALDTLMFEAIEEAGKQLAADRDVRAVVLSGEGRAFCAGLDMGKFSSMGDGEGNASAPKKKLEVRTHGIANGPQHAVWVWRELNVPVIAAVHGVAFGGGLQVALGADMRYVTPDARMSIMEIKWGLVPDMGATQLLRHLARDDLIRELTYTGRIFSGTEALEYGFATRVCEDPHAAAMDTAREIAERSPDAIRAGKELLNAARYLDAEAGLTLESCLQDSLIRSPNQVETVRAVLEKRPANYN